MDDGYSRMLHVYPFGPGISRRSLSTKQDAASQAPLRDGLFGLKLRQYKN